MNRFKCRPDATCRGKPVPGRSRVRVVTFHRRLDVRPVRPSTRRRVPMEQQERALAAYVDSVRERSGDARRDRRRLGGPRRGAGGFRRGCLPRRRRGALRRGIRRQPPRVGRAPRCRLPRLVHRHQARQPRLPRDRGRAGRRPDPRLVRRRPHRRTSARRIADRSTSSTSTTCSPASRSLPDGEWDERVRSHLAQVAAARRLLPSAGGGARRRVPAPPRGPASRPGRGPRRLRRRPHAAAGTEVRLQDPSRRPHAGGVRGGLGRRGRAPRSRDRASA